MQQQSMGEPRSTAQTERRVAVTVREQIISTATT